MLTERHFHFHRNRAFILFLAFFALEVTGCTESRSSRTDAERVLRTSLDWLKLGGLEESDKLLGMIHREKPDDIAFRMLVPTDVMMKSQEIAEKTERDPKFRPDQSDEKWFDEMKRKVKRDHLSVLIVDYKIEEAKQADRSEIPEGSPTVDAWRFRVLITYSNTALDREYPKRLVFLVQKYPSIETRSLPPEKQKMVWEVVWANP